MNKLSALLFSFILPLLWQDVSLGATKTFATEEASFSLDIPDNWQEERQQGEVILSSPDKKTYVVFSHGRAEGRTAKSLAIKASNLLGSPQVQERYPDCWGFSVTENDIQIKNFVRLAKDSYVVFSIVGNDPLVEHILLSMQTP